MLNWFFFEDGRQLPGVQKITDAYEIYVGEYTRARSYFECDVTSVRLHEDKLELYTTSTDGCARAWDYQTGRLKKVLMHEDYRDDIVSIDYCLMSGNVITASHDTARVRVWSSEYRLLKSFRIKETPIRQIRFINDGNEALIQAGNGLLSKLNLNKGLVTSLTEGTLEDHFQITRRGVQRRFFSLSRGLDKALIFNSRSDRLETHHLDGCTPVTESEVSVTEQTFEQRLEYPSPSMIETSNHCEVALLAYHDDLHLCFGSNFSEARLLSGGSGKILDFSLSSNGQVAVASHEDGTLSQWDVFRGASISWGQRLPTAEFLQCLSSSGPGSSQAFSIIGIHKTVASFETHKDWPWQQIGRFNNEWIEVILVDAFNERVFIASGQERQGFDLVELEVGEHNIGSAEETTKVVVRDILKSTTGNFCLSGNNRLLAACDFNERIRIFDLFKGNCLTSLPRTTRPVKALAWVDDIQAIAVGFYQDNHVLLRFLNKSARVLRFKTSEGEHSASVHGLIYLDSKKYLVGWGDTRHSDEGTCWVWGIGSSEDPIFMQNYSGRNIEQVTASSCESLLFVLFSNSEVIVFETKNFEQIGAVNLHYGARAISAGHEKNKLLILNDAVGIGACELYNGLTVKQKVRPAILWSHSKTDWVGPVARCHNCGTYSEEFGFDRVLTNLEMECTECKTEFTLEAGIFDGASQFDDVLKMAAK